VNDIKENIWQENVTSYEVAYEKLFAKPIWSKSLLPLLKAWREVQIRTILQDKDPQNREVARGIALGLEMIMNLPAAIEARKKMGEGKSEPVTRQTTTGYEEGLDWPDEENDLT